MTRRIARAAFIAGLVLTILALSSGQAGPSIAISGDVKQALTLTASDLGRTERQAGSRSVRMLNKLEVFQVKK